MSWESNHPSSGGVGINFALGGGNDDELRKQKFLSDMLKDFVDQGYAPDAAQFLVDRFSKTGKLDNSLPSFSNAVVPPGQLNRPVPLPSAPDIPERSTLQSFGSMKKKGFMALDQNNPPKTKEDILNSMIPIPDEYSSVTPVTVSKKNTGEDIFVDAHTGNEIRREPNNSGTNKVIRVGANSGAEASNKGTPAQQAALAYIKDWYKQSREGTADPNDPVLPSMAKAIGLDISEIPSIDNPTPNPTFLQKVFGITPETPPPTPGKKFPVYPGKNGISKSPQPAQPAQSDNEKRAADFLTQHGQKVTPANIQHAIKSGWVK